MEKDCGSEVKRTPMISIAGRSISVDVMNPTIALVNCYLAGTSYITLEKSKLPETPFPGCNQAYSLAPSTCRRSNQ